MRGIGDEPALLRHAFAHPRQQAIDRRRKRPPLAGQALRIDGALGKGKALPTRAQHNQHAMGLARHQQPQNPRAGQIPPMSQHRPVSLTTLWRRVGCARF